MNDKYFTYILLPIVAFTLGFAVYNSIADHYEMQEHHLFFTKITKFAYTGERFTSKDGLKLCDEINKIKFHYNDLDLVDCDMYGERDE